MMYNDKSCANTVTHIQILIYIKKKLYDSREKRIMYTVIISSVYFMLKRYILKKKKKIDIQVS